jgi:hypothetical protein
MAIAVLIDLGLDQPPDVLLEQRGELLLHNPSFRSKGSYSAKSFGIEARRAALGCFHLSSLISIAVAKPNTLPVNDFAVDCARELQKCPQFDTDHGIYPIMHLQQLVDEARDLYRMEQSDSRRSRLHSHADRLVNRLEQWRISVQPELRDESLCYPIPSSNFFTNNSWSS